MRPRNSPQLRFFLRGSALLIGVLLLWWWLLTAPLVGALRLAADVTIHALPGGGAMAHIATDTAGNWQIQAPAPAWLGRQGATQKMFGATPGQAVKVRSIRLAVSPDVPVLFTLVFPVFWAIALAAPWSRRSWRVLLVGTALMFLEAWLAILLYAAAKVNDTLHMFSATATTVLDFAEYLNMYVAPYLAPILIALALHRELRTLILFGEPASDSPPGRRDAEQTSGPRINADKRTSKPRK